MADISQSILECENSKRILKNISRQLKESSFKGDQASEVSESLRYLRYLEEQMGAEIMRLKEEKKLKPAAEAVNG